VKLQSEIVHLEYGEKCAIVNGEIYKFTTPITPYAYIVDNRENRTFIEEHPLIIDWEDDVGLLTYDTKEPVIRFYTQRPSDMRKVRDEYCYIKTPNEKPKHLYESDIRYEMRLCLDEYFKVDYTNCVCYLDIETTTSMGFPKVENAGMYPLVSVAVMKRNGEYEFFYAGNDEKQMFIDLVDYLKKNNLTVMVGWNSINFDLPHLIKRAEKLGLHDEALYFKMMSQIDMYEEYKNVVKGLSQYSLKAVSIHEKLERIKNMDKMIDDMTYEELKSYNLYDVEILKILDDKYGFTALKTKIAELLNLPIGMCSPLAMGDVLTLRRVNELGYVAKDRIDDIDVSISNEKKGAMVFTPKLGVRKKLVYFDYASMYPYIIINENIDIEGFNGEVMPYIEKQLLDERAEYKKLYKETGKEEYNVMQQAVKILGNCFTPDTDIITVDGIKNIRDVKIGDKVYNVNPETMELEIDEVIATYEFDKDDYIYHFSNRKMLDLMTTSEHRFLVKKRNSKNVVWRTARELYDDSRYVIPKIEGVNIEYDNINEICGY
jgi:DNA polymerase elongation subunit (family B)